MILFCFLLSSLMHLEFIWTIFNIKQQFQLRFSFEGWGKEIIIWTLNGVKQKKGVLRIFWGNYFLHFLKSLKKHIYFPIHKTLHEDLWGFLNIIFLIDLCKHSFQSFIFNKILTMKMNKKSIYVIKKKYIEKIGLFTH